MTGCYGASMGCAASHREFLDTGRLLRVKRHLSYVISPGIGQLALCGSGQEETLDLAHTNTSNPASSQAQSTHLTPFPPCSTLPLSHELNFGPGKPRPETLTFSFCVDSVCVCVGGEAGLHTCNGIPERMFMRRMFTSKM